MKRKLFAVAIVSFCFLMVANLANAQTARTMTGTVVREIHGGRWSAIVIKVGRATYGVEVSHEYSAGEEMAGYRYPEPKLLGDVEKIGSRVTVYYTKSSVFENGGVRRWLTATKVVRIR